jgi:hypothetical protein
MNKVAEALRVRAKFEALSSIMNEKMRRHWAATEAESIGWGGVSLVSAATGLSRTTITVGIAEIHRVKGPPNSPTDERLRKAGGGRKSLTSKDPGLMKTLESLVDSSTRGHPMTHLRWTSKSTYKLANEICNQRGPITDRTVAHLLKQAGYSLQSNRKTKEGTSHPDRNAQFEFINSRVSDFLIRKQPAVSIDTKKKELVGEFKNNGKEWRPNANPELVKVHDFPVKGKGKAIPFGVYDMALNEGWVSVGIDHDTAEFAAASIGRWWKEMGKKRYPHATSLLITADSGGSNSSRSRLWKVALQKLANKIKLELNVCHFPPGTSKWNKIEHRLFSYITKNWRGRPLVSYQVVVNLISNTTTRAGLLVKSAIDDHKYETGIKVSDEELSRVNCVPDKFHGEWNYAITSIVI